MVAINKAFFHGIKSFSFTFYEEIKRGFFLAYHPIHMALN